VFVCLFLVGGIYLIFVAIVLSSLHNTNN
jgi:hypothetical protein